MNSAANSVKERDFAKLLGRAIRYRDSQEYENSIRILRQLAKIRPNSASVYGILGEAYWRLGRLKPAVRSFRRATELSPRSELASLGLFHTLWESGKIESAKAEMKRYMAVGKSDEYASMTPALSPAANSSKSRKSMKEGKRLKPIANGKNSSRRRSRPPIHVT